MMGSGLETPAHSAVDCMVCVVVERRLFRHLNARVISAIILYTCHDCRSRPRLVCQEEVRCPRSSFHCLSSFNGDQGLLNQEGARMNPDELFHLLAPHIPTVSRLSMSLLRDKADAEDVVQETLLKAFTHIHQLRSGESIKAWFTQIAVNEARMRMRTRRRFSDPSETDSVLCFEEERSRSSFFNSIPDPGNIPDIVLERSELTRSIRTALDRLKPKYREAFVLRDVLGVAALDAAAILGISEAALNSRLNRGRAEMRKTLAPVLRSSRVKWRPFVMMKEMFELRRIRAVGCRKVTKEMRKYLDNDLEGETLRQIETHLRICSRCFLVLDGTRKTLQLVADETLLDISFLCNRNWKLVLTEFAATQRDAR